MRCHKYCAWIHKLRNFFKVNTTDFTACISLLVYENHRAEGQFLFLRQLTYCPLNTDMIKNTNTILWVDDDADDLQIMQEILVKKKQDYRIVEAHNGKEALEYLETAYRQSDLPCLIILDINMPVLDGKETLAIIKGKPKFKNIPVVVFTTSESELDKMYCQRFATEMITKPPTFSTLGAVLDKLLNFCK